MGTFTICEHVLTHLFLGGIYEQKCSRFLCYPTELTINCSRDYFNRGKLQKCTIVKILVVCEDVQQPDIEYLKTTPRLFGKSQISIDFWSKPQDVNRISSNFKNNNKYKKSPIAIWRLFTPINFQNYDKLLYLDNDVIVKTDVNNLFNLLMTTI